MRLLLRGFWSKAPCLCRFSLFIETDREAPGFKNLVMADTRRFTDHPGFPWPLQRCLDFLINLFCCQKRAGDSFAVKIRLCMKGFTVFVRSESIWPHSRPRLQPSFPLMPLFEQCQSRAPSQSNCAQAFGKRPEKWNGTAKKIGFVQRTGCGELEIHADVSHTFTLHMQCERDLMFF